MYSAAILEYLTAEVRPAAACGEKSAKREFSNGIRIIQMGQNKRAAFEVKGVI